MVHQLAPRHRAGPQAPARQPAPAPLASTVDPSLPVPDAEAQLQAASRLGHRLEDVREVTARGLPPSRGGQGLSMWLRRKMEASFGADLSSVRVHEDGNASELGAHAFTRGEHIHFAPGRYQPHSASGQALLGHELTHVLQQRSGRAARQGGNVVLQDERHEREADGVGARAARGQAVRVSGAAPSSVGSGLASLPAASPAPIQGLFNTPGDFEAREWQQHQERVRREEAARQQRWQERKAALAAQFEPVRRRQARRNALWDHFDVRDDHQGPLRPNQLTTNQFDNVADLHERIRGGRTALRFAGADERGRDVFMSHLARISQTLPGRHLLTSLAGGRHPVRVKHTRRHSKQSATPDNIVNAENGYGTGSKVKYSTRDEAATRDLPHFTPDTTLFHELTHAHHFERGTRAAGKLRSRDLGPLGVQHPDWHQPREEYATVGLGAYRHDAITENAYRAEQRQLQATHAKRLKYALRTRYSEDSDSDSDSEDDSDG